MLTWYKEFALNFCVSSCISPLILRCTKQLGDEGNIILFLGRINVQNDNSAFLTLSP